MVGDLEVVNVLRVREGLCNVMEARFPLAIRPNGHKRLFEGCPRAGGEKFDSASGRFRGERTLGRINLLWETLGIVQVGELRAPFVTDDRRLGVLPGDWATLDSVGRQFGAILWNGHSDADPSFVDDLCGRTAPDAHC